MNDLVKKATAASRNAYVIGETSIYDLSKLQFMIFNSYLEDNKKMPYDQNSKQKFIPLILEFSKLHA